MNHIPLTAILLLVASAHADESSPTADLVAVQVLADTVNKAGELLQSRRATARNLYQQQLVEAVNAALEAKDLETANKIDAGLKLLALNKPFVIPRFQKAIEAERTYEEALRVAEEQFETSISTAHDACKKELQARLDAALAAKDLSQSNRINDAITELERKIEARNAGVPKPLTTVENSIEMKFVWLPKGEFQMGSPTSDTMRTLDEVQHTVRLTRQIAMSIHEVTQIQYERVTGKNPSRFRGGPNHPVDTVSWHDAVAFCDLLSALPAEKAARRIYRLPSEAEWEYACRAGTDTAYGGATGSSRLGQYAWFQMTKPYTTNPVGSKRPNRWGLYDMHGNVWEWCNDWYGPYTDDATVDPVGPESGNDRIIRGGAFFFSEADIRSARRLHGSPDNRDENGSGFRVVLEISR